VIKYDDVHMSGHIMTRFRYNVMFMYWCILL